MVCCLRMLVSLVSLSPMLACRNQGREIFLRPEPAAFGGLLRGSGGVDTDITPSPSLTHPHPHLTSPTPHLTSLLFYFKFHLTSLHHSTFCLTEKPAVAKMVGNYTVDAW